MNHVRVFTCNISLVPGCLARRELSQTAGKWHIVLITLLSAWSELTLHKTLASYHALLPEILIFWPAACGSSYLSLLSLVDWAVTFRSADGKLVLKGASVLALCCLTEWIMKILVIYCLQSWVKVMDHNSIHNIIDLRPVLGKLRWQWSS